MVIFICKRVSLSRVASYLPNEMNNILQYNHPYNCGCTVKVYRYEENFCLQTPDGRNLFITEKVYKKIIGNGPKPRKPSRRTK